MCCILFFFKQKTAYEMRISDWSSDVCSSDLPLKDAGDKEAKRDKALSAMGGEVRFCAPMLVTNTALLPGAIRERGFLLHHPAAQASAGSWRCRRSEEHTSELQSLMRISYAVFCLKKKKKKQDARTSCN